MSFSELNHAVEETEEEVSGVVLWTDAVLTQFVQERPIPAVYRSADASQVLDAVIECVAVDMVDSHSRWDGLAAPSAVHRMRGEDTNVFTPCLPELEIIRCTMTVLCVPIFTIACIDRMQGAVRPCSRFF